MATAAPVLFLDEVDSTNAEARRRAEAGETGPLWIAARRQTAGRGRRGRAWESDGANLTASLLQLTQKPPAEAAQVTFIAALATVDLLDAFAPAALVSIKWPNDVLLDGRKVSGVLIESGQAERGLWLTVGIGVNLAQAPQGVERPATCIAEHLRADVSQPPSPDVALAVLSQAFATWIERWESLGFEPVLDAWRARARGLDGPCVARLGHETIAGQADGVEADGALRLRLADGTLRRVSAGDVFFGEEAA